MGTTQNARVQDPRDAALVIRLHNSGLSANAIARRSGLRLSVVQSILGAPVRRGRTLKEAATAARTLSGLPEVFRPIRREALNSDITPGEQLPRFADHDRYVAAVMEQGGFVAWTEHERGGKRRLGLPLIRPVFAGAGQ